MGFLSVGIRLYFQVFHNSQRDFGYFECCTGWTSQFLPIQGKKMKKWGLLLPWYIKSIWYKVCNDGIIYKLTQNGISGNMLNLLENFLKERKQYVVLNGMSLHGKLSMLEHLKNPSLVLCCFSFTLMILQKASRPM